MIPADATGNRFTVVVERSISAPAGEIFDAWLDDGTVGHWLFATPDGVMKTVSIDPRPGGRYTIAEQRGEDTVTHFGQYAEIERPRRLVFGYSTDPGQTISVVTVEIADHGDASRVTLTHEMDPDWAEYEESIRNGWTGILEGLDRELQLGE